VGWVIWGLNPTGNKICYTCPDQPWGPPSLLFNTEFFLEVKWLGHGGDHPPPSSTLLPLWAFMACSRVNFLPLLCHINVHFCVNFVTITFSLEKMERRAGINRPSAYKKRRRRRRFSLCVLSWLYRRRLIMYALTF
jgi:hypothetical protein